MADAEGGVGPLHQDLQPQGAAGDGGLPTPPRCESHKALSLNSQTASVHGESCKSIKLH